MSSHNGQSYGPFERIVSGTNPVIDLSNEAQNVLPLNRIYIEANTLGQSMGWEGNPPYVCVREFFYEEFEEPPTEPPIACSITLVSNTPPNVEWQISFSSQPPPTYWWMVMLEGLDAEGNDETDYPEGTRSGTNSSINLAEVNTTNIVTFTRVYLEVSTTGERWDGTPNSNNWCYLDNQY